MDHIASQIAAFASGQYGAISTAFTAVLSSTVAAATSFSFTGVAIGAAADDRLVVVGVTLSNATTTPIAASAVSVSGVAATQLAAAGFQSIWAVAVPAGTTATIDVTAAASADGYCIGVWSLTGAIHTPAATASAATAGSFITLHPYAVRNGAVIYMASNGGGAAYYSGGSAPAFDNLVRDFDDASSASAAGGHIPVVDTGNALITSFSAHGSGLAVSFAPT